MFEFDLDITKTNILSNVEEDLAKTMGAIFTRVLPDEVLGRILVLSLFGFSAVAPTSDRSLSTLA